MRVLAVDTSTPSGSVAVVGPEGVLAEARVATTSGHSRWLLPAVDALLRGLDLAPGALDAFAVTTGPGSFTGLRVGLSSTQGLALASGRPCVGLPALDVLGLAAAGQADTLVALMDAFRGEVYSAVYDAAGARQREARVGSLEAALEGLPPGAAFVGDAVAAGRERIGATVPAARFPSLELFLAAPLGRAALVCLERGETIPASRLRPLYLRGAAASLPRR